MEANPNKADANYTQNIDEGLGRSGNHMMHNADEDCIIYINHPTDRLGTAPPVVPSLIPLGRRKDPELVRQLKDERVKLRKKLQYVRKKCTSLENAIASDKKLTKFKTILQQMTSENSFFGSDNENNMTNYANDVNGLKDLEKLLFGSGISLNENLSDYLSDNVPPRFHQKRSQLFEDILNAFRLAIYSFVVPDSILNVFIGKNNKKTIIENNNEENYHYTLKPSHFKYFSKFQTSFQDFISLISKNTNNLSRLGTLHAKEILQEISNDWSVDKITKAMDITNSFNTTSLTTLNKMLHNTQNNHPELYKDLQTMLKNKNSVVKFCKKLENRGKTLFQANIIDSEHFCTLNAEKLLNEIIDKIYKPQNITQIHINLTNDATKCGMMKVNVCGFKIIESDVNLCEFIKSTLMNGCIPFCVYIGSDGYDELKYFFGDVYKWYYNLFHCKKFYERNEILRNRWYGLSYLTKTNSKPF